MQIMHLTILLASFAATNVLAKPLPNAEAGIEARAEQAEQANQAAQAEQVNQGAQAEQVNQGAQVEQDKQGEQYYPGYYPGRNNRWRPQRQQWWNLRNPFPSPVGNQFGWDGQQCPWQTQSCGSCRGFYQGSQGVCGQGWARGCPCY